jgi:hypothetical protein
MAQVEKSGNHWNAETKTGASSKNQRPAPVAPLEVNFLSSFLICLP